MRKERHDMFLLKNGRMQNVRGYRGRRRRKRNLCGLFLVMETILIGGMAVCFFLQNQSDWETGSFEIVSIYGVGAGTFTGSGAGGAQSGDLSIADAEGDSVKSGDLSITDAGAGGVESYDLSLTDEEAAIKSGDTWRGIFENEEKYPADLLNALKRNPEICDFAAGYLTADTEAAGGITSKESKEECPLFLQWDKRWGYVPYGQSNIGISGCGPTCLSMVLYSLTRDEKLTPDALAKEAMDGGYYVAGQGTKWSYMEEVAPRYGVFVFQEMIWDRSQLELYLDDEKLIICDMGPGDFTDSGHFIVIRGYENGKFIVNDPFSRKNSNRAWDYDVIAAQCRQIWVYAPIKK